MRTAPPIYEKSKKKGSTNLSLDELKRIWEAQNGTCPLTDWKLILPIVTQHGDWENGRNSRNASLDRIDSSKGYVIGNVRYIALIANYARNNFSDNDVIGFANAVVSWEQAKRAA